MAEQGRSRTDERLRRVTGRTLRTGVLVSALVVAAGGTLYLREHAFAAPQFRVFRQAAGSSLDLPAAVGGAARFDGSAIIQLGLLLLVATPVMWVVFSAAVFAAERDVTYVVVTCIVLAALFYGLVGRGP